MPREACHFCRRARIRHKTKKKNPIFWHLNRKLSRKNYRQIIERSIEKSAFASMHTSKNVCDGQNNMPDNSALKDLVNLINKDKEVEGVPFRDQSEIIVPESIDTSIIVKDLQSSTVASHENDSSKLTTMSSMISPAEKVDLAHFKISALNNESLVFCDGVSNINLKCLVSLYAKKPQSKIPESVLLQCKYYLLSLTTDVS
ncbi:unnamed protein product [Thelazia callipaeda]|uniref:THAP-type domain-containing protein n=1 Tax=Thelazia callipaeda TaxID=103827 RepID=A0A0N5D207_THECL|nr:unnamed protein product [Thelazia callipaeda]